MRQAAVVLIVISFGFLFFFISADAESGQSPAATSTGRSAIPDPFIEFEDSKRLTRELSQSRRIEFFKSETASRPTAVVETLGLLDSQAEEALRRSVTRGIESAKRSIVALWQGKIGEPALEDFFKEADLYLSLRMWEAALECLARREYWTVASGTKLPKLPDTQLLAAWSGANHDGKEIDVIFPLRHSQYRDLKEAVDNRQGASAAVLENEANEFNNLDYDTRKQRYQDYVSALHEMKKLSQAGSHTSVHDVLKRIRISAGLRFEDSSYRLVRR